MSDSSSSWRQPTAVWAIAFACAVSFMGIGLVDPILLSISQDLNASPSETMLLFTSYLFVTGIAMFFTSWVSSRIGVKKTLLTGLFLIVVFAASAGLSVSVGQIIGFRAGWGLGNALFLATALAGIVGAASGGSRQAIVLYEAALGIGLAIGPLVGGALGAISWRGPFFGTATLMAIAFVVIVAMLKTPASDATQTSKVPLTSAFTALQNPALRTLALTALTYNFAFFTLLAYSPYPIEAAASAVDREFGSREIGLVFFGWGLAVAVTSVLVAPILTRRFGLRSVLYAMLALLGLSEAILALGTHDLMLLIVMVVIAGLFIGVLNTALTEAVMEATDLPRSIASSTYSGVRFIGGAIAPAVAGPIANNAGSGGPYWFGVAGTVLAIAILAMAGHHLSHIAHSATKTFEEEGEDIALGDAA